MIQPGYIGLYHSGELERRTKEWWEHLSSCDICPRRCGANRFKEEMGFCDSGYLPAVASFCDHHGEEPPISGTQGSGAVFFGNCTLKCLFCQNHQVSQDRGCLRSRRMTPLALAEGMVYLQDELGCHNINLVSPTHFAPQIVEALLYAVPMGLRIPLVYNTNAFETATSLQMLNGVVDVYLPDLKYASNVWARQFSQAPGYVECARETIREMYDQVGNLVINDCGVIQRGLVIRLLILPNDVAGCQDSLAWLADEVSTDVAVSVMTQYFPCHRASQVPLLARKVSTMEYSAVVGTLEEKGFENGWIQGQDAPETYLPDFERVGHPFAHAHANKKLSPLLKEIG